MRLFTFSLALGLTFAGGAQALVRTFEARFTDLRNINGAMQAIGIDPSTDLMVHTWTFDDAALSDDPNFPHGGPEEEVLVLPMLSYTVRIGGIIIDVTNNVGIGSFDSSGYSVFDGILEGGQDGFETFGRSEDIGTTGFHARLVAVQVWNSDQTLFGRSETAPAYSGLRHPAASQLEAIGKEFALGLIQLDYVGQDEKSIESSTVTFAELTAPVPLPAGLPLLAGALGLLAAARRRR